MRDVVVVEWGRTREPEQVRAELEPLWREVLGRRLRSLRLARGERLIETAARAGISPQYLSEIERGLKEPSSEMVAAIAGALSTRLVDLTIGVADELRRSAGTTRRRDPETAPADAPETPIPTNVIDVRLDSFRSAGASDGIGDGASMPVLAFAA